MQALNVNVHFYLSFSFFNEKNEKLQFEQPLSDDLWVE